MSTYPTDRPVAATLDAFGDCWTLLIVRDLLRGRSKFSELRETVEGIPGSVLSDRLKTLERDTSKLEAIKAPFPRMSYDEAVKVLAATMGLPVQGLYKRLQRIRAVLRTCIDAAIA